jgi:hypothetical protein
MDNLIASLKNAFYYQDGKLMRKQASGKCKAHTEVGSSAGSRYAATTFNGKRLLVHRIIYAIMHNELPDMLDHINGNSLDNRIENLRKANPSQNGQNKKTMLSNKSGVKNVHWLNKYSKWRVCLRVNKSIKHIGLFDDLELADLVAKEARNKYFGAFANHGV